MFVKVRYGCVMAVDPDARVPTRRERVRAATVEEIKSTAMELMRESGTPDVRFIDIARAMGMTAPALYRYFNDRDELFTALIVDGFDDFGTHLRDALAAAPVDDLPARVLAAALAYRTWAVDDPQRFALVFGLPVAGFAAPPGGPILQAGRTAMGNFQEIVRGRPLRPLVPKVGPALAEEIGHMADAHNRLAPPGAVSHARIPVEGYQSLLLAWASMHGFACLEAFGHFDWLSEQARDELFRSQAMLLVREIGGQPPEPSDRAGARIGGSCDQPWAAE